MMNELYTENYYKRLYDWCEAHGCKLTGHSVEETLLFTQMWGCAGCTPSYEYEHIPGIDNLSKTVRRAFRHGRRDRLPTSSVKAGVDGDVWL